MAGAGLLLGLCVLAAVALTMFAGGFTSTVPVVVVADRAGLVMDVDAKVKLRGVEVGRVASVQHVQSGGVRLKLDMQPDKLRMIPRNALVDIRSVTFFGAKFVDILPPKDPDSRPMAAGQIVSAEKVTVEFNTLFEQLTQVLDQVQPEKLNETLGAISTALHGRGEDFGQALQSLNRALGKINPALPVLTDDIRRTGATAETYGSVTPELLSTLNTTNTLSATLVDQQRDLDHLLTGVVGLSDAGNKFIGENSEHISRVAAALVPTLRLTNKYDEALTCVIGGLARSYDTGKTNPEGLPGLTLAVNFIGGDRPYEFPQDLPKVNATGAPQCTNLPILEKGQRPPYVVADVGVNPFSKLKPSITLNTKSLQQLLFGPLQGQNK